MTLLSTVRQPRKSLSETWPRRRRPGRRRPRRRRPRRRRRQRAAVRDGTTRTTMTRNHNVGVPKARKRRHKDYDSQSECRRHFEKMSGTLRCLVVAGNTCAANDATNKSCWHCKTSVRLCFSSQVRPTPARRGPATPQHKHELLCVGSPSECSESPS